MIIFQILMEKMMKMLGDDIEDGTEDDSIKSGDHIFPGSDSKYLKKSKVKKLSKRNCV